MSRIQTSVKLLSLVVAAGSASSVAHAQSWANPVNGNWFDAAMWSPTTVPIGAGATGTLGLVGSYTAFTTSNTLLGVNIPNALATMALNGGNTLTLAGGAPTVNTLNGTIVVNTAGNYAGTGMIFSSPSATFNGTGSIRLNASPSDSSTTVGTSYLGASGGGSLVMGAGTTLGGFGLVNGLPTSNAGTFTADVSGYPLRIQTATHQNTGLYTAANGGVMVLVGATINQSGPGRIAPQAGSNVQLHSTTVNGGALISLADARVQVAGGGNVLSDVTVAGGVDQYGGTNVTLGAPGMDLNAGAVYTVNMNGAYAGTHLYIPSVDTPIGGSGTVRLNASPSDPSTTVGTATITATGGGSLSIGEGVTVAGFGYVGSPTISEGLFTADTAGRVLRIQDYTHQNNNVYSATGGGALVLVNTTINQASDALIMASGVSGDGTINSNVQLHGVAVNGGTIASNGAARAQVNPGANGYFSDVDLSGGFDVYGGANLYIDSPGITLVGGSTLLVNTVGAYAGTHMRTGDAATLIGGNGTVRLNASPSDPNTTVGTASIREDGGDVVGSFVFAPGVTVAGFGIVDTIPTVNNGVFAADTAARQLRVQNSTHQNNNLYHSLNGGTLVLVGATVNQAGGARLYAGNDSVVVMSSSRVNGGTVGSMGGTNGLTYADNTVVTLDAVAVSRHLAVNGGGTLVLPSSVALTNNAVVTVNTNADYAGTRARAEGSPTMVTGTGTIRLNASTSDSSSTVGTADLARNAEGTGWGFGPGVTVDGFGRISDAPTTNSGNISANVLNRPLRIDGNTHQNNNRYSSSNGGVLVLVSATVNQSGVGVIETGDGSAVHLFGTTLNGGSLTSNGSGRFVVGSASVLNNLTNGAPIDQNGGAVLSVTGTVVNNGLITVNTNGDYAGTSFRSGAPGATLNGGGELRLKRSGSDPSTTVGTANVDGGVGGATLTMGAGHTLSGSGQLTLPVTMHGRLSPGVGPGGIDMIRNSGSMTFSNSGNTIIDIASAASFDRVVNAGTMAVDGTLTVTTTYDPLPGATFDIVTGGTVTGGYDQVLSHGLAAPKRFGARVDPGRVRVTVLCGLADIAGAGADGNGDGSLDNNDFIVFINRFFALDPRADFGSAGGVQGADGLFDNNDFIAFIDLFFAGCF